MSIPYAILFTLMLIPALIAVAFASRRWPAILWNFTWFLIFAKVGLEAFGSLWGAFPALLFALNYALRAMRSDPRPQLNIRMWGRGAGVHHTVPKGQPPAGSTEKPRKNDVIEAEFRRE
jgi:hypothetical protein